MIEYEVKVLDIHPDAIIESLDRAGFFPKPKRDFRRAIFDIVPRNDNSWVRLRTDGQATTLTLKEFVRDSIDGMREIEVAVSSFGDCLALLKAAGLVCKSLQENTRIDFSSAEEADIDISIDQWPGIPPYLEIEGPSVDRVEELVSRLGLSKHKRTSATTAEVYNLYGKSLL